MRTLVQLRSALWQFWENLARGGDNVPMYERATLVRETIDCLDALQSKADSATARDQIRKAIEDARIEPYLRKIQQLEADAARLTAEVNSLRERFGLPVLRKPVASGSEHCLGTDYRLPGKDLL